MNEAQARLTIEQYIAANWNPPKAAPIGYENLAFTPPEKNNYALFTMRISDRRPADLGGHVYRTIGFVTIQVRAPKGYGTTDATAIADHAKALFDGVNLGANNELRFSHAVCQPISGSAVEQEYLINVRGYFRFDEHT